MPRPFGLKITAETKERQPRMRESHALGVKIWRCPIAPNPPSPFPSTEKTLLNDCERI